MSIFSKIGRFVKKAIPKELKQAAPALLGMFNPLLGAAAGVLSGGSGQATTAALPPGANGFMSSSPKMLPWMGAGMALPALPAIAAGAGAVARVLPGAGAAAGRAIGGLMRAGRNIVGGKWSRRAIAAAGYYQIGQLVYDAAGNIVGTVGRRRMNPLNHRALQRSISRVCAARRICKQVEAIAGPRRRASSCAPRKRKCR